MPWAHNAYIRLVKNYPKILEEIKNKLTVEMYNKEILTRAEILKRDFTKRQLKIIGLIFTFSYPYGKEWALIPKMRDFELAGISKIKIRKEIEQLIELNVIEWKQEENLFRIKDPREWEAGYHSGYNDIRSRELFALNLQHGEIDVESLIENVE